MKIVGISGSSTGIATNYMLKILLDATGYDYELIKLNNNKINHCLNCKFCHNSFDCGQKDDMQKIYQKLIEADVIVLGSPTYFDNVSGIMKNFMDRCLPFYFSRKLENKKVVLLSVAGFANLIERDEKGDCVWCIEDNDCERSVSRCLDSMRYFANLLGMGIVGEVASIHGDPEAKKDVLVLLGKSLVR